MKKSLAYAGRGELSLRGVQVGAIGTIDGMKKVFIYDSCVTRDAVPQFQNFGLEMVGYVARQSLISAFSKADISKFDLRKISSSF